MIDIKEIEFKVKAVIEKIRPYLIKDGGDVEFVKYEQGIVYVKMLGACMGCVSLDETLKDGLEAMLLEYVPGVVEVRNVGEEND